eukprot:gene2080-biopygen1308
MGCGSSTTASSVQGSTRGSKSSLARKSSSQSADQPANTKDGGAGSAYAVPPALPDLFGPSSQDILQEDLEAPQPLSSSQKLARNLSNSHMQRRRRSLRAKEHKQKLGHFIAKRGAPRPLPPRCHRTHIRFVPPLPPLLGK